MAYKRSNCLIVHRRGLKKPIVSTYHFPNFCAQSIPDVEQNHQIKQKNAKNDH